jgi:hypothetical protein
LDPEAIKSCNDVKLAALPPPHRCAATVVRDFLRLRFVEPFLRLDSLAYKDFVMALPDHAVTGGGVYDASSPQPLRRTQHR